MGSADLARELAFAHALAERARSVTVRSFGGRRTTSSKPDGTPVTEVDLATEDLLRAAIEAAFPDDAVIGEERGRSGPPGAARAWTLDPIDGTKQFADGVPLWATLIGLSAAEGPVLGLADVPMLDERYAAARGGGATRNGLPIRVSTTEVLDDATVGHSGLEEWLGGSRGDALARVALAVRRTRGMSDAWGHMLVAAGSIDACLEHEACGVWDWTPVAAIVSEAGGRSRPSTAARSIPGATCCRPTAACTPRSVRSWLPPLPCHRTERRASVPPSSPAWRGASFVRRSVIPAVVVLVSLAAAGAVRAQDASPPSDAPVTLRIGTIEDMVTDNPLFLCCAEYETFNTIYDKLVEFDPESRPRAPVA